MAFISIILWEKKSFKITNVQKKKTLENSTKISLTMSSESAKEQNDLNNQTDAKIPGKIKLSELEIAEREKKLRMLSEKWKKRKNFKRRNRKKIIRIYKKFRNFKWSHGYVFSNYRNSYRIMDKAKYSFTNRYNGKNFRTSLI